MALRYHSTGAVTTGGLQFNHGLTNQSTGAAIAPTEWFFNNFITPQDTSGGIYLTAAPTTTSLTLAMSSGTGTADVFCSAQHSIIQ